MKISEHAIQCQLMHWWKLKAGERLEPLLFAIPNGGKRNRITGSILKAEGVRAGVPDLFLAIPAGGWHGLFIELKTERGSTSDAQKAMIARLNEHGYLAEVCKGLKAAISVIEDYLARGNNG